MACTNLACRDAAGCLEIFENGEEGSILTIGPLGTPIWDDPCPCNFIVDNLDGSFTAFDKDGAVVATWRENTVTDTATINLTLSATQGISGVVIVSPDLNNCLEARSNGLYAPCSSAAVTISPDANNCLVENANGLYVACPPDVTVTDTNTIDFTAAGHNVTGNVKISTLANNCLVANASGLYVPCVDVSEAADREIIQAVAVNYTPSATPYTAQTLSFNINNTDATRTLHVDLDASGSLQFNGPLGSALNVDTLHGLLVNGSLVMNGTEQSDNGTTGNEFGSSTANSWAFTIPPGGSALIELRNQVRVNSGSVTGISFGALQYSWQGILV